MCFDIVIAVCICGWPTKRHAPAAPTMLSRCLLNPQVCLVHSIRSTRAGTGDAHHEPLPPAAIAAWRTVLVLVARIPMRDLCAACPHLRSSMPSAPTAPITLTLRMNLLYVASSPLGFWMQIVEHGEDLKVREMLILIRSWTIGRGRGIDHHRYCTTVA